MNTNLHIILISGFRQSLCDFTSSGLLDCYRMLRGRLRNSRDVDCHMLTWDADMDMFADFIKGLHSVNDLDLTRGVGMSPISAPKVVIAGYSWGGAAAIRLAKAFGPLAVEHLILVDPVYRHWYWLGQWRAFWPWKRLDVSTNVKNVTWMRQDYDFPRSHHVVRHPPTRLHGPYTIDLPHRKIDNHHSVCDVLLTATAEALGSNDF